MIIINKIKYILYLYNWILNLKHLTFLIEIKKIFYLYYYLNYLFNKSLLNLSLINFELLTKIIIRYNS